MPSSRPRHALATLAILAVAVLIQAGCGGSPSTASGLVRFDNDEPVRSGSIEFRSLADGSRYASRIASDGSFTLTNADGDIQCPAGKYEVVVVQIVLTEDLAADAHSHGKTVPRKYADYYTSGLRVDHVPPTPIRVTLETPTGH